MSGEEIELKPCPFCRSPAELEEGRDEDGDEWFNLGCSRHWGNPAVPEGESCPGARIWYFVADPDEKVDLIRKWNTRAHEARLEGERGDGEADGLSAIERALDEYETECIRYGQKGYSSTDALQAARKTVVSLITSPEQQPITPQLAPHIGMDYLEIRRRLSELSGVPTMAITTDEHLTRIKARLERESITLPAGSAPQPVSLHRCAMSLQGNPRIQLGSDLQQIARIVLEAAGVKYVD